ncbi:MAG TPA: phosphotransferase [Steroidobacteraceae bacterium]
MSSPTPDALATEHRDPRLAQLEQWLTGLFGARDFSIATASADASFRRYFRVTRAGQSWIAMDAPPGKEDIEPYIRIANMLVDIGVNAPRVMERDLAQGFLLNSDLGSRTYLTALSAGAAPDSLYDDAMQALVQIQSHGMSHARQLPAYDAAILRREMALFPEWFCEKHLQLQLSDADRAELEKAFAALIAAALDQPRVFVHRDYHSRNLMVSDGRHGANPGILDFQDALYGPVTYDLVSLLRDCYVAWPIERVHEWVVRFRTVGRAAGVDTGRDQGAFLRWFDLMGVQRHLKAIGIFARLWHRDGKAGYLPDIPRTLNYVRVTSAAYPELQYLQRLIDSRILPALNSLKAAGALPPEASQSSATQGST